MADAGRRIGTALRSWSQAASRPLVVFLDEIDALADEALISVLRQLRDGYRNRPERFPWSLALMGLRDVRDYKLREGAAGRLGTASPFNIKVESITLRDFNAEEVAELYQQHTDETGQVFTPEAVARAFELTRGQPWLANALARQITWYILPDRAEPITLAHMEQAKEELIARQDTHLDSLAERLREPRVRHIIGPMLEGTALPDVPQDDIQFVIDLGLCRLEDAGGLVIANPIYREVLARVLATTPRASLPHIPPTWLTDDGRIDISLLLANFVAFWRRNGEALLGSAPYPEIAPHLVMMAYLDRVANAGGTLEREYAIGRRRMDLLLRYGPDTFAFELKVWRDGRPDPLAEGLEQIDTYLAGLGAGHGLAGDLRPSQWSAGNRGSNRGHRGGDAGGADGDGRAGVSRGGGMAAGRAAVPAGIDA